VGEELGCDEGNVVGSWLNVGMKDCKTVGLVEGALDGNMEGLIVGSKLG